MPVRASLILLLLPFCAAAQQRDPAVELYALTGGYFHGNLSMSHEWRPEASAGVLVPLGRRWGALADVTTSAIEGRWRPEPAPGAPEEVAIQERRVALTPSIIHLWRRERFSMYAGAGVGQEHERSHVRCRAVAGPVDVRRARTDTTLLLRAGAIVSLGRKLVVRAEYFALPRYADETPSMGLTIGVGYRF